MMRIIVSRCGSASLVQWDGDLPANNPLSGASSSESVSNAAPDGEPNRQLHGTQQAAKTSTMSRAVGIIGMRSRSKRRRLLLCPLSRDVAMMWNGLRRSLGVWLLLQLRQENAEF